MNFPRITLRHFERLISSKAVTVPDLVSYCRRIAVAGEEIWKLNAFASILPAHEIEEQARQSQERWDSGEPLSPLDGVPISVKGNLAVESRPLTAGSAILGAGRNMSGVGYSADAVRSLQDMGAIVIGITNMDEFGMGSLGNNVACGEATKNPLPLLLHNRSTGTCNIGSHEDLVSAIQSSPQQISDVHEELAVLFRSQAAVSAGGSSCGGAASVAHGSSLLSLGSDTGGSIRLPAAWCGLAGIRPTYGRVSRHGLVSYASSFDTVGVLANSPDCIGLALHHMVKCNNASRDSTLPPNCPDFNWQTVMDSEETALSGLRVGIPSAFSVSECPVDTVKTWMRGMDELSRAGAVVDVIPDSVVSPEVLQRSLASYFILVTAEASSNLARYDGLRYGVNVPESTELWDIDSHRPFSLLEYQYASARTQGFGPEVIRRILCGTAALSADQFHTHYEGAATLRADLTRQLRSALRDCDLLLVPTVCFPPPSVDETTDPVQVFANDVMTVPASLAGLPALSVPFGSSTGESGYPLSLQLIGRDFDEYSLLRAASVLDRAAAKGPGSLESGNPVPPATWSIASLELEKKHPPVRLEVLEDLARRALIDLRQLDNTSDLQQEVGNMIHMMNQIQVHNTHPKGPSMSELEVEHTYDVPRNVEIAPVRRFGNKDMNTAFSKVWNSLLAPKTKAVGGHSYFRIQTQKQ